MAQIITEMLDVSPGGIPPIIHLSQYDKLTRTIVFNLIDDTGTYYISSGAIATVRGTKPDKTGFEYEFFSSAEIPNVEFAKQSCRRENAHRSRHFSRARDYKPRAMC